MLSRQAHQIHTRAFSFTVAGPNPRIHSHSKCPDVALKSGCCSAIQKTFLQAPITAEEGRGVVLSFTNCSPDTHSQSHSLFVVLNIDCTSEIQTMPGQVGQVDGSTSFRRPSWDSFCVAVAAQVHVSADPSQMGEEPGLHCVAVIQLALSVDGGCF